jgi:hypothetical protein
MLGFMEVVLGIKVHLRISEKISGFMDGHLDKGRIMEA